MRFQLGIVFSSILKQAIFPLNLLKKNSALFLRSGLVYYTYFLYFGWLMSSERPSQPNPVSLANSHGALAQIQRNLYTFSLKGVCFLCSEKYC